MLGLAIVTMAIGVAMLPQCSSPNLDIVLDFACGSRYGLVGVGLAGMLGIAMLVLELAKRRGQWKFRKGYGGERAHEVMGASWCDEQWFNDVSVKLLTERQFLAYADFNWGMCPEEALTNWQDKKNKGFLTIMDDGTEYCEVEAQRRVRLRHVTRSP